MEEARSGQPNAVFPAAHVQLHQLAQDQLAEAPRETMARQVLQWSLMAARPHPSPSMREVEEEGPGQPDAVFPAAHAHPSPSRPNAQRLPLGGCHAPSRRLGRSSVQPPEAAGREVRHLTQTLVRPSVLSASAATPSFFFCLYSTPQRHPPSSSAVSPLAAGSTTVPAARRTVVPRPYGGPRSGVAFASRWVRHRRTLPSGGWYCPPRCSASRSS